MSRRLILNVAVAILASQSMATAENYVLTIGGGYSPSGNQASLEKNVMLFQRVLADHSTQVARHDVFFADGQEKTKDLQVQDPQRIPEANRLMAEFFGSTRSLGLSYRNHQVENVRNASRPKHIKAWFSTVGSRMQPGDRLFVYVTAHGSRSRDRDRDYNTSIATWGNTSVKMTEFAKLLDQLDPGINVTMVMVQCYTGGFSHLMYREGDPSKGLSPQRRVGFYATVHDRPAAGCTPDVNEANYIEYSTFFWAALSGKDRLGKPIDLPDYDQDGNVSLEEAHAYTVLNADTIDVPVKTSGEFLLRESRFGKNADDELLQNDEPFPVVLKLASPVQKAVLNGLSKKLKLNGDNRLVDAWQKTQVNRRRRRSSSSESATGRLKAKIAASLKKKWPELANTMNPVCIELLTTRSDEFVEAIKRHPDYAEYRRERNKQDSKLSDQETRAQYERFLRVADNVLLAENLKRMNKPNKLAEFESLVSAERQVFLNH